MAQAGKKLSRRKALLIGRILARELPWYDVADYRKVVTRLHKGKLTPYHEWTIKELERHLAMLED